MCETCDNNLGSNESSKIYCVECDVWILRHGCRQYCSVCDITQ